jgi:hypothetical protein
VANFSRAKQAKDDNIIQHTSFAYWRSKATDTFSENEIFIAFPRQQRLRERDSILRYTYRGADNFLARPGRKQATATEDFDFHIFYL